MKQTQHNEIHPLVCRRKMCFKSKAAFFSSSKSNNYSIWWGTIYRLLPFSHLTNQRFQSHDRWNLLRLHQNTNQVWQFPLYSNMTLGWKDKTIQHTYFRQSSITAQRTYIVINEKTMLLKRGKRSPQAHKSLSWHLQYANVQSLKVNTFIHKACHLSPFLTWAWPWYDQRVGYNDHMSLRLVSSRHTLRSLRGKLHSEPESSGAW